MSSFVKPYCRPQLQLPVASKMRLHTCRQTLAPYIIGTQQQAVRKCGLYSVANDSRAYQSLNTNCRAATTMMMMMMTVAPAFEVKCFMGAQLFLFPHLLFLPFLSSSTFFFSLTQLSLYIFLESVDEDQRRLERQMPVWFILFADKRVGVQITLSAPLITRANLSASVMTLPYKKALYPIKWLLRSSTCNF